MHQPDQFTDRTLAQRLAALEEGNRIRTVRAGLKRDLKAGRVDLVDLLDNPDVATMKLYGLLLALPKIGRAKANRIIRDGRISPSKTVGGLSARQRLALRELVRAASPSSTARFTRQAASARRQGGPA